MSRGVLTSLIWLLVAAMFSAPAAATRFALSMGNNEGLQDETILRWANADAVRMADILTTLGGVTDDRMTLSTDASTETVERAMAKLQGQIGEARHRGERTEVIVYYSGHGDLENLHLGNAQYSIERLKQRVAAFGADTVVTIIDACRSSPLRSGSAKGARRSSSFDVDLQRDRSPTGTVFIASASSFEVAQESDDWQSAFFSHHLFAGLRGAADANADAVVTLDEAYTYAYQRTLQESFSTQSAVQHPEARVALEGEGSLILSALRRADARLSIPKDMPGTYLITDGRTGRVILEFEHSGKRLVSLAVPTSQLLVRRRHAGRNYVHELAMVQGTSAIVDAPKFREVTRTASATRGASDLTPWTIDVALLLSTHPLTKVSPFLGVSGGLRRRLFSSPFSLYGRGRMVAGATRSARWQFWDGGTRLTTGATADTSWQQFRLWCGGGVGVTVTGQRRVRFDAARLSEVGIETAPEWGYGIGPTVEARAGLGYVVQDGFTLQLNIDASASAFRVTENVNAHFDGGIGFGAAYEF